MTVVRPSVSFKTVFAPFLNALRRETGHSTPFGPAGDCAMSVFPFWLISHAHEKLPQNLNPGFLSTIFAFRAKTDDDVILPRHPPYWVRRVTSACMEVTWQRHSGSEVARVTSVGGRCRQEMQC